MYIGIGEANKKPKPTIKKKRKKEQIQYTNEITVLLASSSDDESVGDNSTPERDRIRVSHTPSQSDTSSTGSSRDNPSQLRQNQRQIRYR